MPDDSRGVASRRPPFGSPGDPGRPTSQWACAMWSPRPSSRVRSGVGGGPWCSMAQTGRTLRCGRGGHRTHSPSRVGAGTAIRPIRRVRSGSCPRSRRERRTRRWEESRSWSLALLTRRRTRHPVHGERPPRPRLPAPLGGRAESAGWRWAGSSPWMGPMALSRGLRPSYRDIVVGLAGDRFNGEIVPKSDPRVGRTISAHSLPTPKGETTWASSSVLSTSSC